MRWKGTRFSIKILAFSGREYNLMTTISTIVNSGASSLFRGDFREVSLKKA